MELPHSSWEMQAVGLKEKFVKQRLKCKVPNPSLFVKSCSVIQQIVQISCWSKGEKILLTWSGPSAGSSCAGPIVEEMGRSQWSGGPEAQSRLCCWESRLRNINKPLEQGLNYG